MDPYLSRTYRGGGGRHVTLPAPLLCLEADIIASLSGRDFPSIWSCGHDWSRARDVLLELADLLLTQTRDSSERLIHLILFDERTPQTHTLEFSKGALNSLQAGWQRVVVGALATLLLDPERYDHAMEGQRVEMHTQWRRGPQSSRGLRRSLGGLASQDFLCAILARADVRALEAIERRLEHWPRDLMRRIRSAAAVALYV